MLRTHIFVNKSSAALELLLHFSKLTMNGFESIRVGVIIHCSLFNDIHLVAKDSPEFNNTINTCLISPTLFYIILYH